MSKNSNTALRNESDGAGFSDADKLEAKSQLSLAFSLAGLIHEGLPTCPNCGTNKKGKIQLKTSATSGVPYWKCHKCSERGDAISILTGAGWSFPDAVNTLTGRTSNGKRDPNIKPIVQISAAFQAVVDVEVYNFIRDRGDLELAQTYYGMWHIDPSVVAASGSRYLTGCEKLHADLLAKFGRDRLIACGVVTVDKNGKDFFLFNDDYPVIEPHLSPKGHVVGMQFRPSPKRMQKVRAHKAWKKRWSGVVVDGVELDASEAWSRAYAEDPALAGERSGYVTPFLSLRGAGTDSLVGCGIDEIAQLPVTNPPTRVYVVEGFKDRLASRTLGAHAYAIPGTGVMPPVKVCRILARHLMVVTLDGDDAGAKGRTSVMKWFGEQNVPAVEKTDMRDGMDVTDILVERYAHKGCPCPTCTDWRETHPWEPATCTCKTCSDLRRSPE